MGSPIECQREVCRKYGANFSEAPPGSRVGIAIPTLDRMPLNGLRVPPTQTTSGWYLWAGEECSDHPDFYEPICIEHLEDLCPAALPFLGLPAGWRFLTDGYHTDVWFDPDLINRPRA